MNKANKTLIYLFLIGTIAIIIGANYKINGNPNSVYALGTGLILKFIALTGLLINNFSKIKLLFK